MFVRLKHFLHKVHDYLRLIICREDLPANPRWKEEGYPYENCWDIDEFFEEAARAGAGSSLYREARRIYWECYWRLLGRYKRGRRFFDVYLAKDGRLVRVEDREKWVMENIIAAANAHGIVPEEAKVYTYRIYRELFGPLAR